METVDHAGYSIKNYKSCQGMDGDAFSLTLYKDGKKIGTVSNGGHGGPNNYSLTNEQSNELHKIAQRILKSDWVEAEDVFIGELINDLLNTRRFKRLCKTNVLFSVKGDKKGSYQKVKGKFTPELKEEILKLAETKWNIEIVSFLNETI